ncbi:MAG: PAS domain-containing protein, partial [Gemmatimonadota bacterium]
MDSIPVRTTAPLPLPAITVKDPSAVNTRQSFVARVFATAGVVVSLLVLVGWTLDVPRLRALGSDMESQANPMSALLFALGGVALWLAATARPNKTRSVRALSLVVFGASIVCFIDAAGGYGIGIDQLLFGAALRGVTETSTPHITAVSAASLVLFALAMLALVHRAARVASAQTALLANLLLAGTALLAFLYRATWFDGIGATMRMARPSAFSLIFLSLGALFLRPREGLTRVVMSAGAGGRLARQLLFWGVVVPVVAGWALIRAYRSGIVTMDVAIMLIVLATVVMLVMLTGWQATIVHDSLEERARTEDALRDSEVRFRLLAENASDVVSLHDLDGQILYISPSCERVFGFT